MAISTVIFTAVTPEARPIARRLRLRRVHATRYTDDTTLLLVTGMGTARARRAIEQLLVEQTPTRVLIAGLCGALDPHLKIAQVIRPTRIISLPQPLHPPFISMPCARDFALLTTDHPITTPAEKAHLYQRTGAVAVDMESAAIASVCDAHHIPWQCLRAVSDTADQFLPPYLGALVDSTGRPRPAAVLRHLLPHPTRLRALMHIARQSKQAAQALAAACAQTLAETGAATDAGDLTSPPPGP